MICIPDEERINFPKAFVVLKSDSDISNAKAEILEICKQKLPEYMIPEDIEFVDDLPRTTRGKIDYRALENS